MSSKEILKNVQVMVSEDCWIELGILRLKKRKKNIAEVAKEILENYTNKITSKSNNNDPV